MERGKVGICRVRSAVWRSSEGSSFPHQIATLPPANYTLFIIYSLYTEGVLFGNTMVWNEIKCTMFKRCIDGINYSNPPKNREFIINVFNEIKLP